MSTDPEATDDTPISGPQPVPPVPDIPQTSAEFAQLLPNPALAAEHQAAPPQELLNPHLYQ
jgi:hypothetical protein